MRKSDRTANYGEGMAYEDLPPKTRKGGKDIKTMSKSTNQASDKPAKKYAKTRGEHYKDIVIAILVTGIIAFIAGAIFANNNNAQIVKAVQAVTPTAEAQAVKNRGGGAND